MVVYELLLQLSKEDIEKNREEALKKEEELKQIKSDRTESEKVLNDFIVELSDEEKEKNSEELKKLQDFVLEENFTTTESKSQFDELFSTFKETIYSK